MTEDRSRARARRLRRQSTDAEQALWSRLRDRRLGGVRFRRQAPIGAYIADFVSHERKLIVELDGGQHAGRQAYDDRRTRWLESRGYRVLRFWNDDVLLRLTPVLEAIALELRESPPEAPSP